MEPMGPMELLEPMELGGVDGGDGALELIGTLGGGSRWSTVLYFESIIVPFESILLHFESLFLYFEGILLYFGSILLKLQTALLYFESILLYFEDILLYFGSKFLYFGNVLFYFENIFLHFFGLMGESRLLHFELIIILQFESAFFCFALLVFQVGSCTSKVCF